MSFKIQVWNFLICMFQWLHNQMKKENKKKQKTKKLSIWVYGAYKNIYMKMSSINRIESWKYASNFFSEMRSNKFQASLPHSITIFNTIEMLINYEYANDLIDPHFVS